MALTHTLRMTKSAETQQNLIKKRSQFRNLERNNRGMQTGRNSSHVISYQEKWAVCLPVLYLVKLVTLGHDLHFIIAYTKQDHYVIKL